MKTIFDCYRIEIERWCDGCGEFDSCQKRKLIECIAFELYFTDGLLQDWWCGRCDFLCERDYEDFKGCVKRRIEKFKPKRGDQICLDKL